MAMSAKYFKEPVKLLADRKLKSILVEIDTRTQKATDQISLLLNEHGFILTEIDKPIAYIYSRNYIFVFQKYFQTLLKGLKKN